jgi:hypothetical protein
MMMPASGQEKELYRTHMVEILIGDKATALAVVDGKLCFRAIETTPEKRPAITVQSLFFWRKDQTLQAFIVREEAVKLKEQAALHLWYFTADYSTDPPRVELTEKRGKYSEWIFELPERFVASTLHYLRNANDLGKSAWLVVGQSEKKARFAENSGGVNLLAPVLTFEADKK